LKGLVSGEKSFHHYTLETMDEKLKKKLPLKLYYMLKSYYIKY